MVLIMILDQIAIINFQLQPLYEWCDTFGFIQFILGTVTGISLQYLYCVWSCKQLSKPISCSLVPPTNWFKSFEKSKLNEILFSFNTNKMSLNYLFFCNLTTLNNNVDFGATITVLMYLRLKSSFSEKATKIWKNLPLVLTLLSKNSCVVKTSGIFFQILWPSHNISTLTQFSEVISVSIS